MRELSTPTGRLLIVPSGKGTFAFVGNGRDFVSLWGSARSLSGSNTTILVFRYTALEGDGDLDGIAAI